MYTPSHVHTSLALSPDWDCVKLKSHGAVKIENMYYLSEILAERQARPTRRAAGRAIRSAPRHILVLYSLCSPDSPWESVLTLTDPFRRSDQPLALFGPWLYLASL